MSKPKQPKRPCEVHSLTLLIGERALQLRNSSQVMFRSAPENSIHPDIPSKPVELAFPDLSQGNFVIITKVFHNVTHLEIALHYGWFYDLEQLIKLLDGWKAKLVSLRITTQRTITNLTEVQRHMLRECSLSLMIKLNQLTGLKSLTLVFHNQLAYQIDLSVLLQLDEFNFSSPNYMEGLFSSLANYVNQGSPVRIDIRNCVTSVEKLEQVKHIARKFDRLDISHELDFQRQIVWLTDRFTSLSALSISIGSELSFNKLALSLAQLGNLTNLALIVNFRAPSYINWDEGVDKSSIPRLTEIKWLTLEVITKKTDDLLSINFDWLFPFLKRMKLIDRQMVLLYEEFMGTNKPDMLHIESMFQTKNQFIEQMNEMLEARPHPEDNQGMRCQLIRKEDVYKGCHSLIREMAAFPRQTKPSDEPTLILEQQHYSDPDRREQFIRHYLRPLKQAFKLECVEVYQRIQDRAETTLLHSYSFDEL